MRAMASATAKRASGSVATDGVVRPCPEPWAFRSGESPGLYGKFHSKKTCRLFRRELPC